MKEQKLDLVCDPRGHIQEQLYNEYYLQKVKNETHWVIIVDLDEFIYSRPPFQTISAYLKTVNSNVAQISVVWKMFGSNGHIQQQQPNNVVDSFIRRHCYTTPQAPQAPQAPQTPLKPIRSLTKTIIRTRYLTHIGIHHSSIETNGVVEITSDHQPLSGQDIHLQLISEEILKHSALHCNHYPIQSYEWFRKVKMTRGDATNVSADKIRNVNYFNAYDSHAGALTDTELSDKRSACRIYYGCNKVYVDVTRQVMRQFTRSDGKITIDPSVDFNRCFGDPVVGSNKYLVVEHNHCLKVYPETKRECIII
jgi:hypothetical protein